MESQEERNRIWEISGTPVPLMPPTKYPLEDSNLENDCFTPITIGDASAGKQTVDTPKHILLVGSEAAGLEAAQKLSSFAQSENIEVISNNKAKSNASISVVDESARLHFEHKLFCLGMDDCYDISVDSNKGLTIEEIDSALNLISKALPLNPQLGISSQLLSLNKNEAAKKKDFESESYRARLACETAILECAASFDNLRKLSYNPYSTSKKRTTKTVDSFKKSVAKNRLKSKQAKKSRQKNRKK